ncbi:TVP38/TMEM64 family protein [Radiobacillus kanasensis]|uniref:TVP38/TMEM64 family protein n=1 Tax=Radiobacillus kanasensis TaxID=2844358 RepID=UPI001E63676A|nr:TVP38/TMEM64 family protein [Radiobacillus kanasensis]UFT98631.1 TVP38/TMEM64 family protein [Radiobacillus kanasensis]
MITVFQTCMLIFKQVFIFSLIGLTAGLISIQSVWFDMRFEGAYFITVLIGVVLWLSCILLITEGSPLSLFAKGKRLSLLIASICLVLSSLVTVKDGSLLFMPAYLIKQALFLDHAWSISAINGLWVGWIVLGFISILCTRDEYLLKQKRVLTTSQKSGIGVLTGLGALFTLLYLGHGKFQITINEIIQIMQQANVSVFQEYLLSFGPTAAVVSGLLMVFQSVIAPLPAFVITFANGVVFGWLWGALLSWSSAMVGAILCFYLARWLGRPLVERIVTKKALQWWDHFFQKYGSYSILIARLVPIVSFDLVSYAAGITPITFRNFFWATGLGQLPATLLYSYLGETATGLVQILFFTFTIGIALAIIGVLLKPHFQRDKGGTSER